MKIYVALHAHALEKEENPQRPISERGRADVAKMSALLKPAGVTFTHAYHSGVLRAEETAVAYAAGLAPGAAVVKIDSLGAEEAPDAAAALIAGLKDSALFAGHTPNLVPLINLLTTGSAGKGIVKLSAGCLICLERADGEPLWKITWHVDPKLLS